VNRGTSQNYRTEQYTASNYTPTVNTNSEQLDSVVREGSYYIISKIPAESKVGIVNMNSSSVNLSNYIIDSIIMHLVNTNNFTVIERSELDIIQKEQRYQLSGEVSDETAVSVGKQLGTQVIVTGAIVPLGNNYSLRIKITNVQTAQIIGTQIYTIKPDNVLLSLLNPQIEESKPVTPQTVIQGDVNITNNNTTTIQGDVYVNMPQGFGW
jgi:TolB-like protein